MTPALQRDMTRLGIAAEKLLTLRAAGGTGSLQRSPAPRTGEASIEQINTGEARLLVQCGDRPRRRFWVAGELEAK